MSISLSDVMLSVPNTNDASHVLSVGTDLAYATLICVAGRSRDELDLKRMKIGLAV